MTPMSVKAAIIEDERVLLLANDRGEWELPGGRLDPGESEPQALAREIAEELGVSARIGPRLAEEDFEVIPGRLVRIVSYGCVIEPGSGLRLSAEHRELLWAPVASLGDLPIPEVYRRAIRLWVSLRISFKNP
ncbi:MAG: NUDIX domain-containing protein [Alphaproteobacteria bacterium]|nr:NUDIX domain-containing protein [Alphaproteobacteria bacterium]